jgi:DNA-binding CsgD family transcriptional regulator
MTGAITRSGLAEIMEAARAVTGHDGAGLRHLAETVAAEIGAESVAFFELDCIRSTETWYVGTDEADLGPEGGLENDELFWPLFWSGACSYTEPGTRFAWPQSRYAVASPARLHGSRMSYAATPDFEYDRQYGMGDYVIVPLASRAGTTRRLLLNRPPGDRLFSEWAHTALRLLQPHLEGAVRRVQDCRLAPELSRREYEVLIQVRAGHDNRTIARLLQVQPSTVRKHLENAYTQLGVHSRTAALAAVFDPAPEVSSTR